MIDQDSTDLDANPGPILRLFEAKPRPGQADALAEKFASTSADVVRSEPGNDGFFYGCGVAQESDVLIFASVWRDLDAVKQRFGDDWQTSFLPAGYDDLIDDCSVRHFDISQGWHLHAPSSGTGHLDC